jgi:hypothetical protein
VLLCLQAAYAGADPLAALTGLTSLTYSNNDPTHVDAVWAVAQLTWLRRLTLKQPSTFTEVQLAQLSALRRLTCFEIKGGDFVAEHPGVAYVEIMIQKPVCSCMMYGLLLCLHSTLRS